MSINYPGSLDDDTIFPALNAEEPDGLHPAIREWFKGRLDDMQDAIKALQRQVGAESQYLGTVAPTGFDGSQVFLYQLDGGANTLKNRVGESALDLAVVNGTELYRPTVRGRLGLFCDSDMYLRSGLDDSVVLLGELTVCWQGLFYEAITGSEKLICIGGDTTSEDEAENVLCELSVDNSRNITFNQEYAAGANASVVFSDATPIVGVPSVISLTRNAAGTSISLYRNGQLIGTGAPSNAPIDGANARVHLAAITGAAGKLDHAVMESATCWNKEMSAAQLQEYVRGCHS